MATTAALTTRTNLLRRTGALGGATVLAVGTAGALLTALATPASASATYTVDDASDGAAVASDCTTPVPGACSLRDAAAAAVDGDTIHIDPSITSIVLDQTTVFLNSVSLTGHGMDSLTISTAGAAGSYDIFSFSGNGDVVISAMTVTTNRIYVGNTGNLDVSGVRVSGSEGQYGGALYAGNDGTVDIVDSEFIGNYGSNNGGAVYIYETDDVTISGSTFIDNSTNASGAGVFASPIGSFTMIDTTIDGNDAATNGGGLYLTSNVTSALITNSTISNNVADGALYGGGGIMAWGYASIEIDNTTITGNAAPNGKGGAIYLPNESGTLTVNQSTIVGNSALVGGGIFSNGDAVALVGTIVSDNTAVQGTGDVDGNALYASVTSDHSLIGSVADGLPFTDLGGTIFSTDPGVAPLANNGGPTLTMALLAGSAAIDAGPDPVPTFPGNESDQRGIGYPRIAFGRADIGAYEIQDEPTPTTGGSDPVIPEFTG